MDSKIKGIDDSVWQALKPDEEKIIENREKNTLYVSNFSNNGSPDNKYLNLVVEDQKEVEIQISPKINFKMVYIRTKDDIESFSIQKYKGTKDGLKKEDEISFSKFQVGKLKQVLEFITSLDLKTLSSGSLQLADGTVNFDPKLLYTLASSPEGLQAIEQFFKTKVTAQDVVSIAYRKEQLEIFEKLLNEAGYMEKYKSEEGIGERGDESGWQHFFEKNAWILGYGLRHIYNAPLDEKTLEQITSGANFNDGGKVVDALMKTKSVVSSLCFVELKTSKTPLLSTREPRSECWSVSNELVDGIAQVQKTVQKSLRTIQTKTEMIGEDGYLTGEIVYMYQPKSYLIIGNTKEFLGDNGTPNEIKFSSFELFRRDRSNPEIITFDELYQRARHIVAQVELISTGSEPKA